MACPMIVPFESSLMSANGTVSEYAVGFVKLTLAWKVIDFLSVSIICRSPKVGERSEIDLFRGALGQNPHQ